MNAIRFKTDYVVDKETLANLKKMGKQLGIEFKRQVPVDRYILDFLAPSVKLVIEVDGACHSLRRTADARRDRVLQRLGYRVLRIDAELVRCNLADAVALIVAALRELA